MKLTTKLGYAALSAAMLCGSAVQAAGFQLTEQGVAGLGRSYAGAGIVGDDLSAIAHNPAGLTLIPGTNVQQNVVLTILDFKYKGETGEHENGRRKAVPVPSGFISHQVNDQLWLGFGITAPYGLADEYDSDWEGSGRGISGSIITIDFNPTIAWKVNEHISLGAGVSAMYTYSKLKNGIVYHGRKLGEFEYHGDDWMFTYDVGVMLSPVENFRLGLSYRSRAKVNAKGDYTIKAMGTESTVYGHGRLSTPETVMFSTAWEATDNLRLSGLIRWSNWAKFDTMRFSADNQDELFAPFMQNQQIMGLLGGLGVEGSAAFMNKLANVSVENNWRAAWLFTAGADYKVNDQWTIRGGLGLETDPIKNQRNRTAVIPDSKRLWLSCGFSWVPNKNWQIDMAYAHLRGIGNNKLYESDEPNSRQIGKFERTNAWLIGGAIQYHF